MALYAAGILALALLCGQYLYHRVGIFQRYLVQPALIAGLLLFAAGPQALALLDPVFYDFWKSWPGYLISFLFAALMLGSEAFSVGSLVQRAVWQQGIYVWFIAISQLALGFCTVLLLRVFWPVDPLFAHIIELGWVGGHGAAGAFKALFPDRAAGDLALFSATMGLLWGSVSGLLVVAHIRKKFPELDQAAPARSPLQSRSNDSLVPGEPPRPSEPPSEKSSIENSKTLPLSLLLLLFSVFSGYLLRDGVAFLLPAAWAESFHRMPVFFLTIFTALAIRLLADAARLDLRAEMQAWLGLILDALIASALAALVLQAFLDHWSLFLVFMVGAGVWVLFCLFYVARRMLPREHFWDLAILNYGMSTGITAVGLMLLQSLRSRIPAWPVQVYGLAAPLSAPFIGGGVLSLALPFLNSSENLFAIAGGLLLFSLLLFATGSYLQRSEKQT